MHSGFKPKLSPPSWRWLLPGMGVKRYAFVASLGLLIMILAAVQVLWGQPIASWIAHLARWSVMLGLPLWASGILVFLIGLAVFLAGIRWMNRSMLSALIDPDQVPEQVYIHRVLEAGPKLVALGGGTGLSRVLEGLKQETANVTAVVAITDDGGSTGRLRLSFGIPAVGDLVDCLSALSDAERLPELLSYRFQRGDELAGHTFGNLLLVTLYEVSGNFGQALRDANRILSLRGAVYPASPEPARLVSELADGRTVTGETTLRDSRGQVLAIRLDPSQLPAMPEAIAAIKEAELIVLGPGSLYTSVIPSFLPEGIRAAINQASAPLVYLVNIMTEPGETDHMDAYAHYQAVTLHLGRRPDVVIANNATIEPAVLARYWAEGQEVVGFDPEPFENEGVRVVSTDLLEAGSFARHDPQKVVRAILELTR